MAGPQEKALADPLSQKKMKGSTPPWDSRWPPQLPSRLAQTECARAADRKTAFSEHPSNTLTLGAKHPPSRRSCIENRDPPFAAEESSLAASPSQPEARAPVSSLARQARCARRGGRCWSFGHLLSMSRLARLA